MKEKLWVSLGTELDIAGLLEQKRDLKNREIFTKFSGLIFQNFLQKLPILSSARVNNNKQKFTMASPIQAGADTKMLFQYMMIILYSIFNGRVT